MSESILKAVEMIAVNFAEWLSKNQWVKRLKTHPKHVGKYWSNIYCEYKTINELYEMFRIDEQKRLTQPSTNNKEKAKTINTTE